MGRNVRKPTGELPRPSIRATICSSDGNDLRLTCLRL